MPKNNEKNNSSALNHSKPYAEKTGVSANRNTSSNIYNADGRAASIIKKYSGEAADERALNKTQNQALNTAAKGTGSVSDKGGHSAKNQSFAGGRHGGGSESKSFNEKKAENRSRKKLYLGCLIFAAAVIVIAVTAAVVCIKRLNSQTVGNGIGESITVTIAEGSSLTEIAQQLEEAGVIDSDTHFLYLCGKNNVGDDFHAGEFIFSDDMTFDELVEMLRSGGVSSDTIKFTIIEGQWISEIAENIAATGFCTADEFIAECNSSNYDYDFVKQIPKRDNLLEGYLYPDTYFLDETMTAHDAVNAFLAEFDSAVDDEYMAQLEKGNLTLDEAVITASLIENEVSYPDERSIVASVIYNRLNQGMKLQMDASVLYALGEKKSEVLYSDLEIEDEHNTYYVDGLPIGPIGNPGYSCLEAAAYPADTDYLYYVLENFETGQHYFTADYDDFTAAKERYNNQLYGGGEDVYSDDEEVYGGDEDVYGDDEIYGDDAEVSE